MKIVVSAIGGLVLILACIHNVKAPESCQFLVVWERLDRAGSGHLMRLLRACDNRVVSYLEILGSPINFHGFTTIRIANGAQ